jgi:hypothetical protein
LLEPLLELGAETVEDLQDLDEEDLRGFESRLKKLQIKRLRRGLEELSLGLEETQTKQEGGKGNGMNFREEGMLVLEEGAEQEHEQEEEEQQQQQQIGRENWKQKQQLSSLSSTRITACTGRTEQKERLAQRIERIKRQVAAKDQKQGVNTHDSVHGTEMKKSVSAAAIKEVETSMAPACAPSTEPRTVFSRNKALESGTSVEDSGADGGGSVNKAWKKKLRQRRASKEQLNSTFSDTGF